MRSIAYRSTHRNCWSDYFHPGKNGRDRNGPSNFLEVPEQSVEPHRLLAGVALGNKAKVGDLRRIETVGVGRPKANDERHVRLLPLQSEHFSMK